MGLLTNRVERNEIKLGDHIYTYRAVFTYSHHGLSLPPLSLSYSFCCFIFWLFNCVCAFQELHNVGLWRDAISGVFHFFFPFVCINMLSGFQLS